MLGISYEAGTVLSILDKVTPLLERYCYFFIVEETEAQRQK